MSDTSEKVGATPPGDNGGRGSDDSVSSGGFVYSAPDDEDDEDDAPLPHDDDVDEDPAEARSADTRKDARFATPAGYDYSAPADDPDDEDDAPADVTAADDGDDDADDTDDDEVDDALDGDGMFSIREQFSTVFDLIDAMIEEVDGAPGAMLRSDTVKLSRSALLDELNELKRYLPLQLNDASAIMRRANQQLDEARTQSRAIISEAHAQETAIIQQAEQRADEITSRQSIIRSARKRADDIVNTAQAEADRITINADEYSASVMRELAGQLRALTKQVDEGTAVLEKHREDTRRNLETRGDSSAD